MADFQEALGDILNDPEKMKTLMTPRITIITEPSRMPCICRSILAKQSTDNRNARKIARPPRRGIGTVCMDVLADFEGAARLAGKRFDAQLDAPLPCLGDEAALRQLTAILADNAVKYAPEGAPICVRLFKKRRHRVLEISNPCPAMTVSYSASSKSYYSGSSASAAIAPADEYRYTLGYKVYGLYKEINDTDDFGRPYYQWRISGSKTVSDEYFTSAAKTYTTAVSSGTLYTDLSSTYAGKATYILNGAEQSKFVIEKNGTDTIGGNGVLTLAYTDASSKSVKLVSIVTYLGCIEEVDGKSSSVVVYYGPGDSESITYNAADYTNLKKGAYVVVAVVNDKVKNMTGSWRTPTSTARTA